MDLADSARLFGTSWSGGSVQSIENGHARISFETLATLQLGLSSILGRSVKLQELLEVESPKCQMIKFNENQVIALRDVATWFETQDPGVLLRGIQKAQRTFGTPRVCTLGKERLASKLGISAEQLQDWSQELWGEAIEARRDRLAGEGASPQKRGRVTGKLLDEIRATYTPAN